MNVVMCVNNIACCYTLHYDVRIITFFMKLKPFTLDNNN